MAKQLGVTLPLQLGSMGYFRTTDDVRTQIKTNLTNLLLTIKGERVFQPDFGWDGHAFLFEAITDDTIAELQASIDAAVKLWLPFVRVDEIDVTRNEDRNTVRLHVTFSLLTNVNTTDTIVLEF